MSDKGKKKRLKKLIKVGYDVQSELLYLPSEDLESDDIRYIVDDLKEANLITLKICIPFQEVANNPFGLDGSRFIRSSPWLNLKRLEMKSTKIGPLGTKQIVKADFKHLVHIRLGFNELGDEGVKHLISGQWKKLEDLWLQGNHIGVEGCHWLSLANWNHLTHLSLWDNKIEIECCKKLLRLATSSLSKLDLTFCNIKGCQNNRIELFLKMRFTDLTITE